MRFGRRLDLLDDAGQRLLLDRRHDLAVHAIDERGDADVDRARRIGPRQDTLGGGAEDRPLRRVR